MGTDLLYLGLNVAGVVASTRAGLTSCGRSDRAACHKPHS